jgi:ELWxxDGT repeat protein
MRSASLQDAGSKGQRKAARSRPVRRPVRLRLEAIEDRVVPAHAVALGPDNLSVMSFGPNNTAQVGNTLYYLAGDGASTPALWQTGGTPATTNAVSAAGLAGLGVTEVVAGPDGLYFVADPTAPNAGGNNVYKLDPNAPGGVKQITQFDASNASLDLESIDGNLYFTRTGQSNGMTLPDQTLYGLTQGAATQLASFGGDQGLAALFNATVFDGQLYFTVYDFAANVVTSRLWVSDGTAAGTHEVAAPGGDDSKQLVPVAVGGHLFFLASDGNGHDALFVSDGTTTTPLDSFDQPPPPPGVSVLPPLPGPTSGDFTVDDGGTLYFTANNGDGTTIWSSNGTAGGTQQIVDPDKLPSGLNPSTINDLTAFGGAVYFTATDTQHGQELWKTDGSGGVTLVHDIRPGVLSSFPNILGTTDGGLVFTADDGQFGSELWITDGTSAGTQRVTDLNPGIGWSNITAVFDVGGHTVIEGTDGSVVPAPTPGMNGPSVPVGLTMTRLFELTDLNAADGTATITTLTSSGGGSTGQPLTLTATVTSSADNTPTGSVAFRDAGVVFGTAPLVNGKATLTANDLYVGQHNIQAVYLGSSTFAESVSSSQSVSVGAVATTLALTTSDSSTAIGDLVTFTATVTPAAGGPLLPSGPVNFYDGNTLLGTGFVTSLGGAATFSTANLGGGGHTISATFAGGGPYAASTSNSIMQTVTASNVVTLTGPAGPTPYGQGATLTAHVVSTAADHAPVTGSVEFREGQSSLGTATIGANGNATLTIKTLSTGTHNVTAVYHGDTDATSSPAVVVIAKAPTTTNLTTSAPTVQLNQSLMLTATVAGQPTGQTNPVGMVTFSDGSKVIGSAPITNGKATLTLTTLAGGTHSLKAAYGGDANYAPGTSAAVNQQISFIATVATTTTLTSSAPAAVPGQSVTFTAHLNHFPVNVPTTVTFKDGPTVLATVPLDINTGSATYTTSSLRLGHHSVTARFSGGVNIAPSTSAALDEAILPASRTTLAKSPGEPAFGQTVTLTATVASATPTTLSQPGGSVTFKDGNTVLGTAPLQNGVATLSTSKLAAGTHNITAVYATNSLFVGSNSAPLAVKVHAAATSTVLQPPAVVAGTESLTANVSITAPGAGQLTGNVTFYDGPTALGSAPVSNGVAKLTQVKLGPGNHNLTAAYQATASFAGSRSGTVHFAVASTTVTALQVPTLVLGQQATLKAVVTATTPGAAKAKGTVTFKDGTTVLGTAQVHDGVGTLNVTFKLGAAPHTLSASFAANPLFLASSSVAQNVTVQKSPATEQFRTFTTSPVSATGQTLMLRSEVNVPNNWTRPTGSITFKEGNTVLGTVPIPNPSDIATLAGVKLSKGTHTLTAVYAGSNLLLPTSTQLQVTI